MVILIGLLIPLVAIAKATNHKPDIKNKIISSKRESIEPIPLPDYKLLKQIPIISEVKDVQEIIIKWANNYGVDPQRLLRVAECESGFNQYANNGTHFGIFQFATSTFVANSARCEAGSDIWSIENQAKTAAYMFSIGQSNQWECK